MWSILRNGNKNYTNVQGHMTKNAAMTINSKIFLKVFFSKTRSPVILKLCIKHQCSLIMTLDDLDLFYGKANIGRLVSMRMGKII